MQKIIIAAIFCLIILSCKKEAVPDTQATASDISTGKTTSLGITGDTADVVTVTQSGFVLMGGSTDVSPAIKWMLQRSGHGDVIVIRSTGTNAYNDYMYDLYPVNSVETLLINSREKANDASVVKKIRKAECLFIAGGDQWDYVNYWKGTLVNDAINYLINTKKAPVGGTSAGCMILGQFCFDAKNGSVTSQEVLSNPYNRYVSFTSHFINIPFLQNIITDTHYDNPDRRGRQTGFMARLFKDSGVNIKGIGVQEYTAVAIDENGIGKVFGGGKAFFLKAQTDFGEPEICKKNMPLTWNKNKEAVSVYSIEGSHDGNGSADIIHFNNFSGGKNEYFFVNDGKFVVRKN